MLSYSGSFTVLRGNNVTLHTYVAPPDGEMVTSHIIETERRLIVVDTQLLRPYTREVRSYADHLGKPIDRVLISHAHPDHWFGLEQFRDCRTATLAEVRADIEQGGGSWLQFKRSQVGDLVPNEVTVPAETIQPGAEVVDGVELVFGKIVDAEAPTMLTVELPQHRAIIVQDIAYNDIYLCVGEKNASGQYLFDGWAATAERLAGRDYATVLPGHGEPTDGSIFPKVAEYVRYAKAGFEAGLKPDEMKARMIERYPNYRLEDLLDFSNVFLFYRTW